MQLTLGKVKGEDGINIYHKYNLTPTDEGASDDFIASLHKYIGIISTKSKTKPIQGYTWMKFIGDNGLTGVSGKDGLNGANGVNGANGKDGKNGKNCFIKFSSTDSLVGATDNWISGQNWIGFALSESTTAPTLSEDYRWCKFIDDTKVDRLQLLSLVYPIGSIYESTVNSSPATFIGGNWEEYGAGRILVAKGTSDVTYNAGNTGGKSNVTLTMAEMPSHRHYMDNIKNMVSISLDGNYNSVWRSDTLETKATSYEGGGQAHDNMPPYIVVYRWRRTA